MLLEIPLNPIPNQQVTVVLNNQQITVNVYLQDVSLFCDVYLGSTPIILGMRANHGSYVNQFASSLNGYLFWWDEDGLDPQYQTLGTIGKLYYSDYDALSLIYAQWVIDNKAALQAEFGI